MDNLKTNEVEMKDQLKLTGIGEEKSDDIIRQRDMKIEDHFEAVNTNLKDKISDMEIVIENATRGLQEEKVEDNTVDGMIEEFSERVCRNTGEKMKKKSGNDISIEDIELCKKMAEDEFVSDKIKVSSIKVRVQP